MLGPLPIRRLQTPGRRRAQRDHPSIWRICVAAVGAALAVWAVLAPAAIASSQSLASSLQNTPVQSIGVPSSSFTSLSQRQIGSLTAEIGRLDPGRIWIAVVSPRSQAALADLAQPVFNDLPAGTLMAVAEDTAQSNTTNWWVGASWQSGDAAETQLNDVIEGYRNGQGSLFQDLRLEIQSFAQGDAAAGHPSLASGGSSSPGVSSSGGGSGSSFPVALVVIVAIVLLMSGMFGVKRIRRWARASHEHEEEHTDALAQAQKDLAKLGDEITRLDIDSSLANASPEGKDEYRHALGCYEAAERRLKDPDDDYQFKKAQWAIKAGLRHIAAADQLFNPTSDPGKEVDDLTRLADLHSRGALTDAEFAEQKAKLLNVTPPAGGPTSASH